jgi:hypothetical protein
MKFEVNLPSRPPEFTCHPEQSEAPAEGSEGLAHFLSANHFYCNSDHLTTDG